MKKYYVGMAVIGLLVGGLTVYVLMLGAQGKQDKQTYERATDIAEELNEYIEEEGKLPDSFEAANITDVPNTITYKKNENSTYTFCVTYKASRGYGTPDITSTLTGAALGGLSGMSLSDYESEYQRSSLYIDYIYDKGENCQTVKPYLRSSSRLYDQDEESTSIDMTEDTDMAEYYKQLYDSYCGVNLQEDYEAYCQTLEGYTNE